MGSYDPRHTAILPATWGILWRCVLINISTNCEKLDYIAACDISVSIWCQSNKEITKTVDVLCKIYAGQR